MKDEEKLAKHGQEEEDAAPKIENQKELEAEGTETQPWERQSMCCLKRIQFSIKYKAWRLWGRHKKVRILIGGSTLHVC